MYSSVKTLEATLIKKISHFEIFHSIERSRLEQSLFNASVRNYKHREIVYRAGDLAQSFCIVIEGAIKLIRHSPKGEDRIMHFAIQGDIIGGLLMNHPDSMVYPISAKSMGPTQVVSIPKSTFKEYWLSDASLQSKLNALLYKRMINIQDEKMMSTSPLKVRLASLLLKHLDHSSPTSQPLSLTLTRQEIADVLGVAVESVIRAMSEWYDNGTIHRPIEKGPELLNIKKLIQNIEQ